MVTGCSRVVVCGALLCGACADDSESRSVASRDQLLFSAPSEASDSDVERSELVVVWSVTSGQPDYSYSWGSGELEGATLTLRLDARPPSDAINRYGVGVAHLVALAPDTNPGEGKVDFEPLVPQIVGVSARYAIIYVDPERLAAFTDEVERSDDAELKEDFGNHWMLDFPSGYACGEGVEKMPGETFDSFKPVNCSRLRMFWGKLEDADLVNWT